MAVCKLERLRTCSSTRNNKIILRMGGYGGVAIRGDIPIDEFRVYFAKNKLVPSKSEVRFEL